MDKRWTACLVASAACLVASVALRAGEPQQPTASSPLVAPSPHRATLDRYCVTCHNARVKAGGLALDTLDVASETGDVGEGGSQAARPHDAACRTAASRRGDLRRVRARSRIGARRRCGTTSESRSDRYIPPPQPHRVSERHPRHPRSRRRRLGAPPQGRCEPWVRQRGEWRTVADAARTLPGSRTKGRAAPPSGGRCRRRPATWSFCRRTSRRRITSTVFRSAREAARSSRTTSRSTAPTRSRCGCRATATRTSRDSPSRSRWSSRSTASACRCSVSNRIATSRGPTTRTKPSTRT